MHIFVAATFAALSVLHCTIGLKKQFPEYTTSDLAWKKARFGNIVSWIGAEFAVQNNGVIVSMSDDRVSKVRARLEEALRAKGMVAGLQKLAGELSWVVGLIPRGTCPSST